MATTTESDTPPGENGNDGEDEEVLLGPDENVEREQDLIEPVAEGEELPTTAEIEPSTDKADALAFFEVCKRLEKVWQVSRGRTKKKITLSKADKLQAILPVKLLQFLSKPAYPEGPPQSLFPLFRLLMPDKDASRFFNMKDTALRGAYAGAYQLHKQKGGPYYKMANFREPTIVSDPTAVGDFALVTKSVLKDRIVHDPTERTGSDWTVGDINAFLDDLADIKHKYSAAKAAARQNGKKVTLVDMRAALFRRLAKPRKPGGAELSPLEHCWLIRIIQQDMRFGIGWRSMLEWYNRHAVALYDAHTSLKALFRNLCNPSFAVNEEDDTRGQQSNESDELSYLLSSKVSITFGRPFKPMLSQRTSFERCLDDISRRHRAFAEKASDDSAIPSSLAFRNPAIAAETKLDGERMLVHISRTGVVKIHSRVGNWYSELYSPVLGPSLRRAVAGYYMDVILDGEVLAYDAIRKETIPFGQNRTVANLRRQWMENSGTVDKRDVLRHEEDKEDNAINKNHISNRLNISSKDAELAAEECWLQFVAFDIVYVEGPDAARFLEETLSKHVQPRPNTGPLTNLALMDRKRLLYKLITVQEDEVYIVATWVIRPNGDCILGSEYFAYGESTKYAGCFFSEADSLFWTFQQGKGTVKQLDETTRERRSNAQLESARARAVNELYDIMVEHQRMEGLIFKDLSTPYYLGDESKALAYWHKFKPDYHAGSAASDLDLVIIGAYFASGLRLAGKPSSFLCACVDSEDPESFFPLCKVNGGSMRTDVLDSLLKSTGFVKDEDTGKYDVGSKWFKEEDRSSMPGFVSSRTFQPGVENGWKVKKIDYPDLWIHPADSRIVSLNAGEIVHSDAFSAGITLRFPRVLAVRSASDKEPSNIECERQLWRIYQETLASRSDAQKEVELSSQVSVTGTGNAGLVRFFTEEQLAESKRKRPRKSARKVNLQVNVAVDDGERESTVLQGKTFVILEGSYTMDRDQIDIEEATRLGWFDKANSVRKKEDVQRFVRKHGGTVRIAPDSSSMVVGGKRADPRVEAHINAINKFRSEVREWKGKKPKTQRADKAETWAQRKGVLSWTYLFSLVHRLLDWSSADSMAFDAAPSFLDYIGVPSACGDGKVDTFARVCSEAIATKDYLRRVLAIISQSQVTKQVQNKGDQLSLDWQEQALMNLAATDLWVVASSYQTLWPRGGQEFPKRATIFPYHKLDLDDDADDAIESVLPLARIMGARTVSELDETVTHILCSLAMESEVDWSPDCELDSSVFASTKYQGLIDLLMESNLKCAKLISPSFVRKRKWAHGS